MKPLFLKIYQNQQLIEVRRFHTNQIVLGSGNVDIRLEGLLPSHAVIQKGSDNLYYIVIQAGVEPGVFIGGQQVWQHPLSSSSIFQLGHYHIEFLEDLSQTTSIASHLTAPPPEVIPFEDPEKTQITSVTEIIPPPGYGSQHPMAPQSHSPQPTFQEKGLTQQPLQPQTSIPVSAPSSQAQRGPQQPIAPPSSPQTQVFTQQQHLPPQAGIPAAPSPPPAQRIPQQPIAPQPSPQTQMFTQQQHLPPQAGIPAAPPPLPAQRIPQQPIAPPSSPQTQIFTQQQHLPPQAGIPAPPPPPTQQRIPQQPIAPPSSPQTQMFTQQQHLPSQTGHASSIPPESRSFEDSEKTKTAMTSTTSQPSSSSSEAVILQPQDTSYEYDQNQIPPFQKEAPTPPHYVSPQFSQSDIHAPSVTLPTEMPESLLNRPAQNENVDFPLSQTKTSQMQTSQMQTPQMQTSQMQIPQRVQQVSQMQASQVQKPQQEDVKSYRKKRTFATSSNLKDINERIQPEDGSVIKVVVTWNEKILDTLYFDYNSTVRVGCHPKNDIILPIFGNSQDSHNLVKIDKLASLFVTYEMKGVLVKGSQRVTFDEMINSGAASRSDTGFTIDLQRGELARVDFDGGLSIFVKYTAPSPKPLIGPFFDLTASELNALVMAIGTSIIMAIFFLINQKPEVAKLEEEVERKAIFVYKPPPPRPIEPIPVKKAPPVKIKPKKVKLKLSDRTKAPQKARQVVKKKKASPVKRRRNVVQRKQRAAEGKRGGEIRQKTKSNRKVVTSANQSNKVKTSRPPTRVARKGRGGGKAPGRKQRDVSKSGLLGVFGRGGQQDSLRTAFDGAGVVENLAERARGSGGSVAGRTGSLTSGGGLAAVGKGGQGESTYGIAGVKTRGRGGGRGVKGYGRGSLGGKVSVQVDVSGGAGESFTGVIDKEAIRRVVKRNVKQLRACYERLAQRDPNASGRVNLNWTIKPNGRVGTVRVAQSQIKDKKTLDCMRLRLASWRFPDPPPGVIGDINYPFVFVTSRQ